MKLPFGLDLVSIIVTVVFMIWVLPMLMGLFARRKAAPAS